MAFETVPRRRIFGVVAPAVLLGLAAWCYQGFPAPAIPDLASPDPASSAPADPEPGVPGHADLPDGPGTTEPGIFVHATPTADGALGVTEIVWLPEPAAEVTLRTREVASAGPVFAESTAIATMVRLTAGGDSVELEATEVGPAQVVELSEPAQHLEVHYVLTGATVPIPLPADGRGAAAVATLTDSGTDLPVVVWADREAVRTVLCPLLAPEAQSCSADDPAAVRTLPGLRSATALVVLQLELPSR